MGQIYLQQISEADLRQLFEEIIDDRLQKFNFRPGPERSSGYLSRLEVSNLLKISLPTLNMWTKQGILQSYRIGNRVLYRKEEVESSLITSKNLKYKRG